MADQAPNIQTLRATVPARIAATANADTIGTSPIDGAVTGVTYTPNAAQTGDNTNKRTYTLVNKGQTGVGTTVIATLDLVTGVNTVAFDEKAFTLSVVANATVVAADDVLELVGAVAGSGLADPGGLVEVTIARTA